jgi:L-seryl-tRNA(Ser) seleniumtransferase
LTSPYRNLPAVEALVQAAERRQNGDALPRELLVDAARAEIEAARRAIAGGGAPPAAEELLSATLARARGVAAPSLRPLINATGVIIQTNLGRAPLSEAALRAMREVGAGYSNLEYDLAAGERGSRAVHVAALLRRLTGAEAALAVNNNAAAIYLALSALALGREVIVSRGQAVEIGGGFRIPDVLRQSGATLVEVGTTNRTYGRDYAAAIGERTALLMRIHTSNFRLTGFVHETALAEMAAVARERGVEVLDDLGSGTLLATAPYGLAPEPTVQESIAAGAGLVTFSGDKLLGGPQAGLIVGREELVAKLRKHPLARALRVDKTTLAGLEATLLAYLHGRAADEIPVWRMIAAAPEALRARAERLASAIGAGEVVGCASAVGGGSLPGETLPSFAVALAGNPGELARRLRQGATPVVGRIAEGRLLLDVRTVLEEQEQALIAAIRDKMTR